MRNAQFSGKIKLIPMAEENTSEEENPELEEEPLGYTNMLSPPLEEVIEKAGSKFLLVSLTANRANDINTYYQGLGSGMAGVAPPQVGGEFSSYLSVAFEELHKDKIRISRTPPPPPPTLEEPEMPAMMEDEAS